MVVKMKKLLILTIFVISLCNVLALTDLAAPQQHPNGPVSHMMENLSVHTSSVTNELLTQLSAKIERLVKSLIGNMEVVVTSALNQLAQPLADASKKINSAQCQMAMPYEELKKHVNNDLSNCTQNLNLILHTFEADTHELRAALEQNVKEIKDLAKECQGVSNETDFGGNVSCYIEKIAEINQHVAAVLNSASSTLVHTRQLGEQAMDTARSCAEDVVVSTIDYLDTILSNCQAIQN